MRDAVSMSEEKRNRYHSLFASLIIIITAYSAEQMGRVDSALATVAGSSIMWALSQAATLIRQPDSDLCTLIPCYE